MNDKQMMHYVNERIYSYENNNETRWTAHRIEPFMIDNILVLVVNREVYGEFGAAMKYTFNKL